MATKNTDRRDYRIIRRIMRGDKPSQETIKKYLYDNGCREIDTRTFQRDLENIRSNFDLEIEYDRAANGYFINSKGSDPDIDQLLRFMELVETTDALGGAMQGKSSLAPFVSFASTAPPRGAEHLRGLLSAIMNGFAVEFDHTKHGATETTHRVVEPYMIKEFDERWHLFAWVPALGAFRTFGLDRISNLVVTAAHFDRLPEREREKERFNSVYGLTYMPDQKNPPAETVRIECGASLLGHLESLPLHPSQTIDGNIVTLHLIINPELTNRIMSFGEHVRVLAPSSLRQTIRTRLEKTLSGYDAK